MLQCSEEWGGGCAHFWNLRAEVTVHSQNTYPKGTIIVKLKNCLWPQLQVSVLTWEEGSLLNEYQRTGEGGTEHFSSFTLLNEVHSECDSGHLAASLLLSVLRVPRDASP